MGHVGRDALDVDGEVVHRGVVGPGLKAHAAQRQVGRYVQAKQPVDAVQGAFAYKQLRALPGLLRRLKDQPDLPGKQIGVRRQELGGSQQHGHVGVVAAGVHAAVYLRAVAGPCRIVHLVHRQRVHVGAQGDHLGRSFGGASPDDAQDAGRPHAAVGDAQLVQGLLHQLGGLLFLQRQLGLAVDFSAPVAQSVGEGRGLGHEGV